MRCTGSTPPPPPAPSTNCTNTTAFGSATINSTGTLVTISTCSYAGEYSTISGAVSGQVLRFTSSATGDYITIRSGSFNGPVVAQGASPLQFTNTFNGTLYAHWNTANGCGTQSSCRATTVQCMSCTAPPAVANDNCSGATLLSCGGSVTVNTTAANTDAAGSNFCGTTISTPGVWYTIAGNGQDMTVSTVGLTSVDTKIMVFSGSCAGLTCVGGSDDFSGLQSQVSWSSVSGTTYYVLAATFSGTGSFPMSLTCVAPPPPYNACNNISNIAACGTTTNVNITAGNGSWDGYGSPFSTPGRENLFTFTPAITASYPITVTNNGSGWIDLFVKASASGCNNSGWTYIDDISGTVTNNVTLTAGVTYYFLLDDEDANGSTGSISIGCPCIGSAVDGTFTYSAPFSISGTTAGGCDDSPLRAGSDRIYAVNVGCAGSYTFSLCGGATWDTYLYLTTAAGGGGTIVAFNDDACSLQSSMTATLAAGTYYVVVEGFSSTSEGAFTLNVSGTGSTPSITGSATDATCNGSSNGSITATVNGNGNTATATLNGNAFNGSASGLAAGTYTLVATNCWGTSSQTFTVGQPAALSAVVTSNVANNEVCVGGDMTLSGSIGGNVIVSYRWESYDDFFGWSPLTSDVNVAAPSTVTYDLTGLSTSGSYQLVVTSAADGSCTASGDILVTVVEDPTLSISSTNVTCHGGNNGTAVANLSGGVAGMQYDYVWNDGTLNLSSSNAVSGLSAGTFYVSATGTLGCDASALTTISEPFPLTVTITSTAPNATICSGGTAPLTASISGGGTVNYQWQFQDNNGNWVNVSGWSATNVSTPFTNSRNASPSATRAYRIVVTRTNDANCVAIGTQLVTVIADPVFTITSTNISCFGASDGTATAVLTGGLPLNYGYNWSSNDGNSSNNNPAGDGTLSVTGLFPAEWVINTSVAGGNFGCYAQSSVFITQPALLVASSTSGSIACNGGTTTVTVSATGGTAPYSGTGSFTVGAGTHTYTVVDANGCTSTTSVTVTEPTLLVVSTSTSDFNGYGVSCNGGSNGEVVVSATGGTTPYSGTGNNAGLSAGNYSYTVTDANGCASTVSATITEPAALSVALTGSDYNGYGVSCYNSTDGSVSSAVTGGVGPFTYSWNNGSSADNISGLGAGDYSVMVTDANGCVENDNISLSEPTKVAISATNTEILCNGNLSTITVITGGGASPYQVNDAGTYNEPAGSYTYDIVDANGCSASTSLTITQPTAIVVNAGLDETVFYGYAPAACADLSSSATGGTGALSLSWTSVNSGGGIGSTLLACPTANEVYTATAVDANGCIGTDQLSICVVDVRCKSGNGPMKVEVCHNGHTICISPNAVPTHLAHGDQLGACGEAQAACGAVASKDLHADDELEATVVAYPNPTENTTTISVTLTKAGNYSVELFDMMGKLVKTVYAGSFEEYENLEFDVDMTNLNTGVYMISVSNGDQKIENIRVMKN